MGHYLPLPNDDDDDDDDDNDDDNDVPIGYEVNETSEQTNLLVSQSMLSNESTIGLIKNILILVSGYQPFAPY